jgi:large subunit ribosomal protein L9
MKIILLKDIQDLGKVNEIKEVADGYARNFLIPKNLVILANQKEIEKLEQKKKMKEIDKKKEIEKAKEFRKQLEKIKVEIMVRQTHHKKTDEKEKLFGLIGPKEIVEALAKQGLKVDEKQIEMKPIKEVGEYLIKVKLAEEIEGEVKIMVRSES